MESGKNMSKAGVLNWTPAPLRTSPPSSATSEDGWEDGVGVDGYSVGGEEEEEEEEDEAEELRAEDFESHMDENGIIGLRDALEEVELGVKGDIEDEGGGARCAPTGAFGGPEEPFPGGSTPAYSEEEHISPAAVTKPSGRTGRSEKCRTPKNISTSSPSCRPNPASSLSPSLPSLPSPPSPLQSNAYPHLHHYSSEELAQSVGIEEETLPDEDVYSESLPESCCSSSSSHHVSHSPKPHRLPDVAARDMDPQHCLKVRLDPALTEWEGRHKRTKDMPETSRTERLKRMTSTPRKMRAYSPGASSSRPSNPPEQPAWSIKKYQAAPPECQHAHYAPQGGRIGRKPRERSRGTLQTFARNRTPEREVRREAPSFRTPDFSKVEPKVYFPKSGYEPPKSRKSCRVSLSPEPTLVFKSPADIAKEILFSSTDAPPSPPPSPSAPEQNSTISIVPEDFRCPQRATRLVEQLQEDYNTLLTRFAEAENTIDRLRLRAKVNLYSDPKRPDQSFKSRMTQEGSKVMTLSFPHAQRAVMGSHSGHQNRQEQTQPAASPGRPCSGSSSSSRGSCGSTKSPSKTLRAQANKFLQQVKRFEDLITSGQLEPFERLKGLSRLVQGLDLLERGYLAARDERRHRGVAEVRPFDPNRELEGLIFQCGTCVEEIRELSEQQQYSSMAPPSPAPRPSSGSLMSEPTEPRSQPQSPGVLLPGDTGPLLGAGRGLSCTSGESGGESEERLLLQPFRMDELDLSSLRGSFQSYQELPTPAEVQNEGARHSPRGPRLPQDPGRPRAAGGAHRGPTQGDSASSDDRATPTKPGTSQSDRPSLNGAERSQDRSPPVHSERPSGQQEQQQQPPDLQARGQRMGRYPSSSLTSLGESGEWEAKSSRLGGASRGVMSQDGIVSPETDSGFVGSDGTPAAAISPLHQRAPESPSLPQNRIPKRQRSNLSVQVTLPLPASGASLGNNGTSRRPMRNGRQERRRDLTAGASQRLVGPTPQTTAGSGSSDPGLESEPSHCVSEYDDEDDDEGQQTTGSSGSRGGHSLSYHHDDPHNAPGPGGQMPDHNVSEAMQELQAEVTRLKERLESSLRGRHTAHPALPTSPPSQPTRAFPAAPQPSTSTPRLSAGRSRVDGGGGGGWRRQGWTVTEGARGEGAADPERGRSASRSAPSSLPPDRPAWTPAPDPHLLDQLCSASSLFIQFHSSLCCSQGRSPDGLVPRYRLTRVTPPGSSDTLHGPWVRPLALPRCVPGVAPQSPLSVWPLRQCTCRTRSMSPEGPSPLQALRAARDMKLTSRRMARSLASGLQYQEALSQSCIY
ncbi:microtubule organization protein AKNA [Gadus chalcogrammus]|uniref:microtubule organization protein AKNA n=1 Tax=Gadus chalcogrammus TaxID=1042646 RepID=UPI0024C4C3FE|nr:microtubule organization protein AKNA [Gadus chalcogrammus]